jgi:hypothetical protein
VIWYLNERELERELRNSKYKKENCTTPAGGDSIRQTLGISTVKSYVAAIADLWLFQKSKGINPHPTPGGEALNGFPRSCGEYRQRWLEFMDRAAGTLQNGYDETKMTKAIRFCWQGHKKQSATTEPYLYTIVDFLLAHNLLLWSQSRLTAEFPDFFTIQLPDEGPTPYFPMVMIMDNSKTT